MKFANHARRLFLGGLSFSALVSGCGSIVGLPTVSPPIVPSAAPAPATATMRHVLDLPEGAETFCGELYLGDQQVATFSRPADDKGHGFLNFVNLAPGTYYLHIRFLDKHGRAINRAAPNEDIFGPYVVQQNMTTAVQSTVVLHHGDAPSDDKKAALPSSLSDGLVTGGKTATPTPDVSAAPPSTASGTPPAPASVASARPSIAPAAPSPSAPASSVQTTSPSPSPSPSPPPSQPPAAPPQAAPAANPSPVAPSPPTPPSPGPQPKPS